MHTHSHYLLKNLVWKSRAHIASRETGHRCHCGLEITQRFSKVITVPGPHTWHLPLPTRGFVLARRPSPSFQPRQHLLCSVFHDQAAMD